MWKALPALAAVHAPPCRCWFGAAEPLKNGLWSVKQVDRMESVAILYANADENAYSTRFSNNTLNVRLHNAFIVWNVKHLCG